MLKLYVFLLFSTILLFSCNNGDKENTFKVSPWPVNQDSLLLGNRDYVEVSSTLLSSIRSSDHLNKQLEILIKEKETGSNDSMLFWKKKVDTVRIQAAAIIKHLRELRTELISTTEGITTVHADTLPLRKLTRPQDTYIPTLLMLGEHPRDVTGSKSAELKKMLLILKINASQVKKDPQLDLCLYTGEYYNALLDRNLAWEWYHFYHRSLSNVLNFFSLTEVQVKQLESIVLAEMLEKLNRRHS
jgi:hypothetical protein